MDPAAFNYDPVAQRHDHSCQYNFTHGALDFSFQGDSDISTGHVHVRAGLDQLPHRSITVRFDRCVSRAAVAAVRV
eukprot:SAG31_NODE_44513_length_262_cov_0.957055_1_plen_75_part_01